MKKTYLILVLAILMAGSAWAAKRVPKAYAAEFGANSVAVINTADNTVLKHIAVPKGVHGVTLLPDGSRVFVSSDESSVISVIDTAKDQVIATIPTGKAPHGVIASRDGRHVFAAIFGDNQILDINAKSLKVERTFEAPAPHNIALSNDGKTLYVAAQQKSETGIVKIDVPSRRTVATVHTERVPRSLNLSPDGSMLTVTEFDEKALLVFSSKTLQLLTQVEVGESPHHTIFTPDGKLVLVVNQITNDLALIDAKSWKVAGKIQVGKKPHWIAPTSDSEYAYVTDEASNDVSFVDLAERKVEATISVSAAPRKIAIQSGKIPEMEAGHEMQSMEHKMTADSDLKMVAAMQLDDQTFAAAVSDRNRTAAMSTAPVMAAGNSMHKQGEKKVTITMQGPPPRFLPQQIEIEAGTTVEWINTGTKVHTVTSDDSDWDSGSLKPGEKFAKKFDRKGTYKYYCIPHEDLGMVGTIVVK